MLDGRPVVADEVAVNNIVVRQNANVKQFVRDSDRDDFFIVTSKSGEYEMWTNSFAMHADAPHFAKEPCIIWVDCVGCRKLIGKKNLQSSVRNRC